ncbi:hypothetical protein RUND412_010083 [Rhizina undulata]
MAQTSFAAAAAGSSPEDGDDIGARLSKLNLPQNPLIMDKIPHKKGKGCEHGEESTCYCFEYITLLDRPEYKDRWVADSPEPETKLEKGGNGANGSVPGTPAVNGTSTVNGTSAVNGTLTVNGTPTANGAGKKKALSLGQYKNRLAGKGPAKSTTPASNNTGARDKKSTGTPPNSQDSAKSSSHSTAKTLTPDEPPPRKRQRTATPPPSLPPPPPPPTRTTPVRAPAPATPNLPPLPPFLSPTLPPAIEEALVAFENKSRNSTKDEDPLDTVKRQRAASNASDKSGRKIVPSGKKPPASSSNTPSARSPRLATASPGKTPSSKNLPKPALGDNTTPKAATSKPTQKRKSISPGPRAPTTSTKHPPSSSNAAAAASAISGPEKTRVVKLKFNRRRKDFASLLKFKPNPGHNSGNSKRSRQDDDRDHAPVPAAKRVKAPVSDALAVSSGGGSAARSPAFKSPALKTNGKDRDMSTPPNKVNGLSAGHSVALRRTESEGHAQTPANKDERNGDRVNGGPPGSAKKTLDNSTQLQVENFRTLHLKFSGLGRDLKYEADGVFKTQATQHTDGESFRQAMIIALDSVLCYIVSFVSEESAKSLEGRSPPVEMWRSIVPFAKFVADKAVLYPTLHGLCKLIEATVRQHLLDMDMSIFDKLAPPDTISKAPTPDAGANGANDRTTYSYLRTKGLLLRDYKELKDCWSEGYKFLTLDDIQSDYPQTYQRRSKKYIDSASQMPKVGDFRAGFQLPLHRNSSLMEALNVGYFFLNEWASIHGVKYQSKIKSLM